MNILDRMINAISPTWGARRLMAREVAASYRGGVTTRTDKLSPRLQSMIGGKSTLRESLKSMRDRARRVYNDNGIGRATLDTEVDYVIGDGLTLQCRTESQEFNREAESEFADFLDSADIRGMFGSSDWQRMTYRMSRQDGDAGVILVDRGGVPKLQMIPADWIGSPTKTADAEIVDGVEIDRVGRPVRFHITTYDQKYKPTTQAVAAENFKFICWNTDPLGVRGESCYAQVFPLLDQIDAYTDAVVIAARMAAVFGLIFKESTGGKQVSNLPTLLNSKGNQQKALTLENGMAKYIGAEDDIVQVQASQPMSQTPDFIRALMRLIGLPFNQPLEICALDGSTSNLSVLRGLRQSYMRACRPRQRKFIWSILTPVWRWWVSRRVKAGEFVSAVPEDYWAHEWMPARLQLTDPVSEAQGAQLEFDMGLNSPQNYCAELGRDYETILIQLEADRKARRERGLPEIRSTLTRDPQMQSVAEQVPATDDDAQNDQTGSAGFENVKAEADAYGVAVRAGAITPQTDDERAFREKLSLPPMSEAALQAWQKDSGARRPITLAVPGQTSASSAPINTEETSDDDQSTQEE